MEKGRVYHSPVFVMRSIQVQVGTKISAVAPKKIAPTAVARNLIRRRIYEAIQPNIKSIIPGTHAIIFAKTEAIKTDVKTMATELKSLFMKAKIGV